MLVRPNDGAIDMMELPIEIAGLVRLLLQFGQDPIPDPGFDPAIEARGAGLPRSIVGGEIPPWCTRP
jgi:hypothetical protein